MASIPKDKEPGSVTVADAVKYLSLPRVRQGLHLEIPRDERRVECEDPQVCAGHHSEIRPANQIALEYALDMRYAGQGYEMTLPCAAPLKTGDLAGLRRAFDEEHKKTFGHTAPDEPVEIVSWRLRGVGKVPPVELPKFTPTGAKVEAALRETRLAVFDGRALQTPVFQRERLDVGATFAGPAIVDQLDATTVVPPGFSARVDEYRNLVIGAA